MSTSVFRDSMEINPEVDFATCDCCGLTEECTPSYIESIRQRYGGKWLCGLCTEAVKDEILRYEDLLSPEEALAQHSSFCNKSRTSVPPEDPNLTVHLIWAMTQVLRRSLESPKSMRSLPGSPRVGTKGNLFDPVEVETDGTL